MNEISLDERRIIRVHGSDFNAVARRNNELIVGKYRLSLQAHRLFLYVLSQVRPEHDEHTEYEFAINELAEAIGVDRSQLYRDMVRVLDELASTMVNVQAIDAEGRALDGRFVRVGLITNRQAVRIGEGGKNLLSGAVTVSIHKELLPYVRALKQRFTETELKFAFRLRTTFAQRLYDLLKMNEFKGSEWCVGREELYGLLAIEKGKFKSFADFRRFALEKAQTEISTHTDLDFDIAYNQVGRKVSEVVFCLKQGGGKQVELLPGTMKHTVFKWICELGVPVREAEGMILKWWDIDHERLKWHASEARRRKAAGIVKSAAAWFRAGVKNDYRPQKSLFADLQKEADAKRAAYAKSEGLLGKMEGLRPGDNGFVDAGLQKAVAEIYGKVSSHESRDGQFRG